MQIVVTQIKSKLATGDNTNTALHLTYTLNGGFVVTGAKLISGKNGLFLRMPNRKVKDRDGSTKWLDICFPCTPEARKILVDAAMAEYERVKKENPAAAFIE